VRRTTALDPARAGGAIGTSVVGGRLASAAPQGTGAARLGAPPPDFHMAQPARPPIRAPS